MAILPVSKAAGLGTAVRNESFSVSADVLQRKILALGTYDPLKTAVTENEPVLVLSAEDAGYQFGYGTMLHRIIRAVFSQHPGCPVYAYPVREATGASAASGSILFSGTASESGTLALYIAGDRIAVSVSAGDTASDAATKTAAAVQAYRDSAVSAAVDGGDPAKVNLTARSKGPWGNDITIEFSLEYGESVPDGLTASVTDMSGGATNPTVDLSGLGTGDSQNELHITGLANGFNKDVTILNVLSDYNGPGDTTTGNYAETVARPFRSMVGDTAAGSAGLSALAAFTNLRKLDRTSGVIAVPGSVSHPAEIGAAALAVAERISGVRAEESAGGIIGNVIAGVRPGVPSARWSDDYTARDTAYKAGISTTLTDSGAVFIKDLVTFYRPDSVPENTNAYRSFRNISVIQNILNSVRVNFGSSRWQGFTVVSDTSLVSSAVSREKTRDLDAVRADLLSLIYGFAGNAWIYETDYAVKQLNQPGSVTVRSDGRGFNIILRVILSGEGGIIDSDIVVDASLAVVL